MHDSDDVAIFWDYENCPVPSNASGYSIVENIRLLSQPYGSVKSFKAYLEISDQVQKSLLLRSELQSSGVSLVDCPHNGRKDVADKMIIVDIFAHAIDNRAPSTIMLITGDRDFAYAISTLRLRRYRIVLVTLSNAHASLTAQASICLDWATHVLVPAEASLRVSGHSKQGSLSKSVQEKQRHSDSPTNQVELAEVDRGDDIGILQAIQDATEKRLAARTVTGQTSFPSNPPSTKSSSIIPGSTSVTDKGVKGEGMANAISADQNTFNTFKPCSSNNAKPLGHPSDIVEDPPFSADDVDMYLQDHHSQYAGRNKSSSNFVETFPSFTAFVPRIPIRPDPNSKHSKVPLQPPSVNTLHIADKPRVLPQPPSRPFANVSSTPSQPSSPEDVIKDVTSKSLVMPSDNATQISASVIGETMSPRSTFSQLQGLSSISPRGLNSSVDSPPAVPSNSSSPVSYENSGRAESHTPYASRPISQPQPTPVYPGKPLSGGVAISSRTSTSTSCTSSVQPSVQHVLSTSDPDSPHVAVQYVDKDSKAITTTLSRQEDVVPSPTVDQTLPPDEAKSRLSPITILSSPSPQPGPPSLEAPEGLSEQKCATFTMLKDKPQGGFATPVPPRKVVPEVFKILVQALQAHMKKGNLRPLRTNISMEISKDGATYARAGVAKFGQYVALAVRQGIVELGGWQGEAWISLNPDWYDAVTSVAHDAVPTPSPSTGTSSSVLATPSSIVLTKPSPTPAFLASTPSLSIAASSSSSSPPRSPVPDVPSISAVVSEAVTVTEDLASFVQTETSSNATALLAGNPAILDSATSQLCEISSDGPGNHSMRDKSSTSEDSGHVDDALPILPVTIAKHEPAIPTALPIGTSERLVNPAEVFPSPKTPLECPPMPAPECKDTGIISTSPPNPSESSIPSENPVNAISSTSDLAATSGALTPSEAPENPLTPTTSQPTLVSEVVNSGKSPFAASLPIHPTPEPEAIPVIPAMFRDLVNCLQEHRSKGTERPNQSVVATYLYDKGPVYVYKNAGVRTFAQYAALAEKKGIVALGGNGEAAWIRLTPDWLMINAKVSSNRLGKSPVPAKKLDECPQHVDIVPQPDMPIVEPQTEAPVAKTAHHESQLSDFVETTPQSSIDDVSIPPTSTGEVSTRSRGPASSTAGSTESNSANLGPSSSISPCATSENDLQTEHTTVSNITEVATSSVARPPSPVSQPRGNDPVLPEIFRDLFQCLQKHRSQGTHKPYRSVVSADLQGKGSVYKKAGVGKFAQYAALAEKKGIVALGGTGGTAWISLKPDWYNAAYLAVPEIFKVLVHALQSQETRRPSWSALASQIGKKGTTYQKAGVSRFKEYIELAAKAGIVEYGAVGTDGWVRLQPEWHDVVIS